MTEAEIDREDLEVPTILRVKKPNTTLGNKEDDPQTGFSFESSRYNWAKEKAEKKEEEEKVNQDKNDDEDSSSFLRMIMD